MIRACSLVIILLLAGTQVRAGDPPTNLRGSVVRVTPKSGERVVGTLTDVSDASLTLSSDTGPKVIPRASIRKLEWKTGSNRHLMRDALVCGGIFGAIGLVLPPKIWGNELDGSPWCTNRAQCGGQSAAGGAFICAIGGLITQEPAWRKVPLAKVSIGIEPTPRGVKAALRLAW